MIAEFERLLFPKLSVRSYLVLRALVAERESYAEKIYKSYKGAIKRRPTYTTLDRLETRGYAVSRVAPRRGSKSVRMYKVTLLGELVFTIYDNARKEWKIKSTKWANGEEWGRSKGWLIGEE